MKKLLCMIFLILIWAVPAHPDTYVDGQKQGAGGLPACSDSDYTTGTSTTCAGTPANAKVELDKKAAVNASTTGSAGSLLSPASELTIASDAITVTGGAHTVDTQEDAASDDLVTINGGADGKVVFLRAAHTDRTVILKETGNIVLTHGTTLTLDSTGRWVMLYYDGNLSKWVCDALTDTLSIGNIATTGTIQGGIVISSDADGMTGAEMTTAGVYGTLFLATGAGTWTLPTAVSGMSLCLMDTGTAHDLILDVQAADTLMFNGTVDSAGDGITNASGSSTGDKICVVAYAAGKWIVTSSSGTWVAQ